MAILTSLPWPAFSARPDTKRGVSMVVVPLLDGDSDSKSREVAREIGRALKFAGGNHVIDTDLTARVIEYAGVQRKASAIESAPAAEALSRAKEKYFQFRFEEAWGELGASVEMLEAERGTNADAGALLVDAHVSRAVIAKSRGDIKKMRESLAIALKINPKLDLKSEEYPPSIVTVLEEERAKLKSGPSGTIAVSSSPATAEVYLNGILQGVTPMELKEIPSGEAVITIRANKYKPVERKVNVPVSGRVGISEKLKWTSGEGVSPREEKSMNAGGEVAEALRVADAMKTAKAVVIDVDQTGKTEEIKARMADSKLRAGHRQIVLKRNLDEAEAQTGMADLARLIDEASSIDLASDPARYIDPLGTAKPILLDKRKRHFEKNPLFWGVIGALAAGAIGGGVLAATSGGGGSGNQTGNLQINFK